MFDKAISSPCRGCENRVLHCHNTCVDYIQFRELTDARNATIREAKIKREDAMNYICETKRKSIGVRTGKFKNNYIIQK